MPSRLVALSGPLAGASFALDAEPLTLGRDRASDLYLHDLAASRQHCVVEPAGSRGRYRVRDLESRHGTLVNGVSVQERELEPGDRIAVGSSLFLFLEKGAEPLPLVEDDDLTTEALIHLAEDGGRYLGAGALPVDDRTARDLRALLRIGNALHALRSTEPLARRLLELVLETIPAGRAALLLLDRGALDPACAWCLDREGSPEPFPLSRTLVQRVVEERSAGLANDVRQIPDLGAAASLVAERIESLIAAPLPGPVGPLGVLYADSREAGARFDEGHLELLTAMAGIASAALVNTRHMEWLEEERQRLEASYDSDLIGESHAMTEVGRLLSRVAPTETTVLILGESGTGKEIAARTLHRQSARARRPFVAINCATLSETLLESELFGHERGAFTGAVERKTGKLEAADTGTLFLDEVGELPLALQARLLRVLQEREFERVGSNRTIRVDVRILAATNRDLEKAIREGEFRDDLYYRLNVISITLPPLRERREDVPLLASHFAAHFSRKLRRRTSGFTPEARDCLMRYDWPGNVRELANAVERALVLGEDDLIRPEDLPEAVLEAAPSFEGDAPVPRYHDALNEVKKRLILDAVEQAGGNVTRAAEKLDLSPNYLHRLISNLDLRERIKS